MIPNFPDDVAQNLRVHAFEINTRLQSYFSGIRFIKTLTLP